MVSVVWRSIPTVLTVEELLDKAFSKAKKAGDAVVDKDRFHPIGIPIVVFVRARAWVSVHENHEKSFVLVKKK